MNNVICVPLSSLFTCKKIVINQTVDKVLASRSGLQGECTGKPHENYIKFSVI